MCVAESVEYFPDSFVATFVTLHPALRTTLTVYYPKDALQVDVNVSCEDGEVPRRLELATGTQWIINTPLLHGQSITTRWGSPVQTRATESKQESTDACATAELSDVARQS